MTLFNGQLRSTSGYLPTEVLSAIFEDCLELDEFDCSSPDPLEVPLVLTWVCKFWRAVALNTRHLWGGVSFIRKADRINDSRSLLDLWITRSGALPFGVRLANIIDDESVLSTLQSAGMREFLDTLLMCSKRWRVLELAVPDVSYVAPVLEAVVRDARVLEHFCITSQSLGINEPQTQYDFSQSSALESVRIITPLILPLSTGNSQTFASLTLLELHFCASFQDCLMWLDMTPNLEQLTLRLFCTRQSSSFNPGRHIRRLPYLTELEVTCFGSNSQLDDPGALLDVLELPALSDLEVDLNYMFDSAPWPHTKNLLLRSGASLQCLCLAGTPMSEGEIVECLRLSPGLEFFDCENVSDSILLALTPRLISSEAKTSKPGISQILEHERAMSQLEVPGEGMDIEEAPEGDGINTTPIASEDLSGYSVMCPNLRYFETESVDACSLQVLYTMMTSRCEDTYKGIQEYVDMSAIRPTPSAFKTLETIILPCDPVYEILSHPDILNSLERTVYF